MRIAVIADIHGNLPAFEAAVEDVRRARPDLVMIAGDVVNGLPDSDACLKLALGLGWPVIRGNHERYVADYGTKHGDPSWLGERWLPLRWTTEQLSEENRQLLKSWPLQWRHPDAPGLLAVHGSPRDDYDLITHFTPDDKLAQMFEGVGDQLVVRAHNHEPMVRQWRGVTIVTTSSVGLPLNGAIQAQYAMLELRPSGWRVEHRLVRYDHDAALRRCHESGYLDQTGAMGRLFFRELLTGTPQIIPFLRVYARWCQVETLTLTEGLERWLGL